ncbi:MAG: hypothetical protein RIT81_38235 [Deltaproteobacteria bacterium]
MRHAYLFLLLVGCESTVCPGPNLDDGTLRVFAGGRVANGAVTRGELARCERGAPYRAFMAARTARGALGAIAPKRVDILFEPDVDGAPLQRIEVLDGVVLVEDGGLPPSVWVHELVHVAVFERRVATSTASMPTERLHRAAEEGVADFIAKGVERRVTAPASNDWSALALADLRFDPHPLGAQLARRLETLEADRALPECLVEMLARATGATPADRIASYKQVCPAAARAIDAWVPAPLRSPRGARSAKPPPR